MDQPNAAVLQTGPRRFVLAIAIVSLISAACGGTGATTAPNASPSTGPNSASPPSASSAQQPVTLEFWNWDTRPDWIAARDQVIKDYKTQAPSVTIDVTPFDDATILPKLQSVVETNTAPDLYTLNPPGNVYTAEKQGWIQPVSDVVTALPAGTFTKSLVDAVTFDNNVWGIPYATFPHVLWYRKDLFAAAGLQPPTTMDELLADAKALNKPPQQFGIALYDDLSDPHPFVEALAAFGASMLDASGKIVINSPETAAGVEFWKQLWQYTAPDSISKGNLDQRTVVANGGAAMILTQTSMVNVVLASGSKVTPSQLGVVAVPNETSKRPVIINDQLMMVIPKGAPHPDEAKKFLEFWFSSDEYVKFASLTVKGQLPSEVSAADPSSAYWTSAAIAPVASLLQAGANSLANGSFILGMYPQVNACEPLIVASGLYQKMGAHAVVDGWSGQKVASWAEGQAKTICGQ